MSARNENDIENAKGDKVENASTHNDAPTVVTVVGVASVDMNTAAISEALDMTSDMVISGSGDGKPEKNEHNANAPISQVQKQSTQQQKPASIPQQSMPQTLIAAFIPQPQPQEGGASNKGKMDADASLTNFKVLYVVTQLCGLTMIVLMGSWIGVHLGGLGSDNPKLEFNWHPLLMTIGLIYLYGNSILVYRGFRNMRKKTLKLAHASIHMGAFILTVIALKTVFDSHNLASPPIPNMYSLHSWLGLFAVIVFCLQYVAGFVAYLAPGLKDSLKVAYMPLHIYFGLFGFVLAIASALMGITEKAFFSIKNYSSLPISGVTANMCGVLFLIFGALVVYLTTEGSYKRKPLPEDAMLLTGTQQ